MLLTDGFWQPVTILPFPKSDRIVDLGAAYMQYAEEVLSENHGRFVRMCLINCSYHILECGVRLFEKIADLDLRVLAQPDLSENCAEC